MKKVIIDLFGAVENDQDGNFAVHYDDGRTWYYSHGFSSKTKALKALLVWANLVNSGANHQMCIIEK